MDSLRRPNLSVHRCKGAAYRLALASQHAYRRLKLGTNLAAARLPQCNLKVMTIQLSGEYVSGYQLSGSTTSSQPTETITLTFSQIVIQNAQNKSRAGWNLLTNAGGRVYALFC